jgi:hypothetical protein
MCSITRAPILISRSLIVANSALANELASGNGHAYHEHQPKRGGVQQEANLIGRRVR